MKPTRGGKRPNAGRKPSGQPRGVMLPWRVPPAAKARVISHARATGRTPGATLVDAIYSLPISTENQT